LLQPTEIGSFEAVNALLGTPDTHVQVRQEPNGTTTFYFNATADAGGYVFQTHRATTAASILHIAQLKGAKVEQVHADILTVRANAETDSVMGVPTYAGVDAGVYLMDAEAGPFHASIGLAADTEVGCKDGSVGCEILGCGVKVGKVCEISVLGNRVGIDWGKFQFW
jgi:hypothetical protein